MFLADLDLSALPSEVIHTLIVSLQDELARRKALSFLQKRNLPAAKIAYLQQHFDLRTYEEEIAHLTALYSSELYGIPQGLRHSKLRKRLPYLSIILAQNWSLLFPHADSEMPKYYVYAHIDPRKTHVTLAALNTVLNGEPFYIGKGSGGRAWDLKRNQGHGKRIQRLRTLGYPDPAIVSIIADNITEQDALILEAKLIYFFGSIYDELARGCLLNLADHVRPQFIKAMRPFPLRDGYHHNLRVRAEEIRLESKNTMPQWVRP